jgi:hypothetical protein
MFVSKMPIAFVETVSQPESERIQLDAAEFPALPRDPEWELISTGDTDHELDMVPSLKECHMPAISEDGNNSAEEDGWIEYGPRPAAPSYVQIASKMTAQVSNARQPLAPRQKASNTKRSSSTDADDGEYSEHFLEPEEAIADDLLHLAKDKGSQRLHDETIRKTRDRKIVSESRYHLTDGRERFVNSDILILPGNMKRRNHELMKSWKWMSKIGKRDSGRGERKKKASGAMPGYAV